MMGALHSVIDIIISYKNGILGMNTIVECKNQYCHAECVLVIS